MKKHLIGLSLLAFANNVMAHTGHGAGALLAAFTHPMTGLDHLTVFLALGFLLAQNLKQSLTHWLGFVLLLGMGIFLGQIGLYAPMVETAIACSVMVLAVVMFKRWMPNQTVLFGLLGSSVVLHGLAHGVLLQSLSFSQTMLMSSMMMLGALTVAWFGFMLANTTFVKRLALQQWIAAAMLLIGGSLALAS